MTNHPEMDHRRQVALIKTYFVFKMSYVVIMTNVVRMIRMISRRLS